MNLLQYENQMFLDAFNEDGLTILAKGLGIERLLLSLLKAYNDKGNLVLVLGTTPQEEEYLIDLLKEENISMLPKIVTAECAAQERYQVYMDAGIVFVTSRILVVDMLLERIPIDLITGIIVYRAHKILDSCQEAFILRLYRQKNKKGFIKALTASPMSFTRGFCQVQRVMRNLFVRKLYLWPRFHAVVNSSLEENKPEVIELQITMTPSMQTIQMALLDVMKECLKAIKRMNPSLDVDEMTTENAVTRSFDRIVKFQLDPIWHQLGPKTKRLIADIKTLRTVLIQLTQYDCITFYKMVKSIRDNANSNNQMSDWLFMDSFETLFLCAKERVYGPVAKGKKTQTATGAKSKDLKPNFEDNPKWSALSETLAEIRDETKNSFPPETVLVITEDERTCSQIKQFLQYGSQGLLMHLYSQIFGDAAQSTSTTDVKKNKQGSKFTSKSKAATKKPKLQPQSANSTKGVEERDAQSEVNETSSTADGEKSQAKLLDTPTSPVTIIHALKGRSDAFALQRILNFTRPKYVIMYDTDMSTVRQLETYQSLSPDLKLRVYFLMYKDSSEEQRYLTTLRLENAAFEFLINEKAGMVIPEDRDGRTEDHPDLIRDTTPANQTVSTRQAGGQQKKPSVPQKVIVDIREFRSELPSLIHRRGINIEPVTLQVGDYILSPDICVERKSVSDLIGSLNSGRLYNQAQAMCRYYKRPVLLIEFDQNKAFSLQGNYYISNEISSSNITSKLILLTLHFTRLRILWSPSPYATAEIFEMLKAGKEQPELAQVQVVTAKEMEGELISEKYFASPQDFLIKMPGVNSKNVHSIMNKVKSLVDLTTKSVKELTEIMGNSNDAKTLWKAIHEAPKQEAQEKFVSNTSRNAPSKKNR